VKFGKRERIFGPLLCAKLQSNKLQSKF